LGWNTPGSPLNSFSKLPVSAFVICKDEARYIENCLRSVDLCSEIIVVDSGSTDGTVEIVDRLVQEGLPIRFMHRDWPGYARQKQFALEQCTQPWCLSIDADERADEELRRSLPSLLAAPDGVVAWRIARRPYLIGYGYTPEYVSERPILRLVRQGKGAYGLQERVHEGIRVKGRVSISPSGSFLHYRPLPVDEQILKENSYSSLKADQIFAEGRRLRPWKMLLSPPYYFLRLYFLRRLFLCGWPGFIQAMTGAVYSFMTEAKHYQRHAVRAHPPSEEPAAPRQNPAE
jgi:glycosyltransferase involved in cell wall biosynthesis